MITVVRPPQVCRDVEYQPPLTVGWGIDKTIIPTVKNTMARSIVPPGGRNQRHFHVWTDALWFILKGSLTIFCGPDHDTKEVVVEAGDFVYIPHGEIHGFMNMSDSEAAELIAVYGEVGHREDAHTTYVEKPWD
jgi:mannose-6-phosphate isomerase-like protein (cupin superfamily)